VSARSRPGTPATLDPPGPRGLPFLGEAWSLMRDPLGFLAEVGRKYGDFVHFRVGGIDAYYLAHPDYVREVLFAQRASFTLSPLRRKLIPVLGLGLLTSEGELHSRQRRLMQSVFRKSRIETYAACMSGLSRRMHERWQPGSEIDLSAEIMRLTIQVAAKTLFSHDIEDDSDVVERNFDLLLDYFTRLMSPFLSLSLKLPLPSTARFNAALRSLDAVIYRMIENRAANPSAGDDLLSLLLRATDGETQAQMTAKQLRDELVTLLVAGYETSANVNAWTLYLIAQSPDADRQLHEEARSLLAGRPSFEAADVERLAYARKAVSEGLRLYPPGWFIGREALADVSIGPYRVPKGGLVLMSQYVMHRDPRFYEEPGRFLPERWTPEFMNRLPRGAYFPFSGGDRHCIGEGFAWQEALLILATILERWKLELVPGQHIRPEPSVTLRPNTGIRMVVRTRR
jgi:cytochrome P450